MPDYPGNLASFFSAAGPRLTLTARENPLFTRF